MSLSYGRSGAVSTVQMTGDPPSVAGVRLLCEAIRVHQTLDFEAEVRELSS
jgi:hypothetical protein